MRFRCERDILVEALATTSRAVAARGGITHAVSGLLFELEGDRLHVTGADVELDLVIESEIGVTGLEDGSCVPPRLVADIVRSVEPGAVTVESGEDEVQFSAGRSQFGVRSYQADEYPKLPSVDGKGVALGASDLAGALRQVVRAASSDDLRQQFTGVLVAAEDAGVRLVATDSYRLALRDLPGVKGLPEGTRVVIPARALTELQRLLSGGSGADESVMFQTGDIHALFEVGNVTLRSKLIKADFPEYRQLIPTSYSNRATLVREPFLDAIRRMRLMVRDGTTSVRVTLSSEGVRLAVLHPELGRAEEDVDAKYEGTEMTMAFNPGYLLDGVEAVIGDEVLVEAVDATKPAMIRGVEDDHYRYLLMPVRIP